MMKMTNREIKIFQDKIFHWYSLNKRDLPWRQTRDPYAILISEVMSQQTQISRVVPKFEIWMGVFPTVKDLANAKISEVLKYWSGLGYNRRALNLKKAAESIVKVYGGKFPRDEKQLLELPGIGKYTARAILCFAFDEQIAVVDTNVRKVIITQFSNSHPGVATTTIGSQKKDFIASLQNDKNFSGKDIETIAQILLPVGRAYDWNQALMDYAGTVLKKEKIVIPKQSKFHGSHRYYRGQILKKLLEQRKVDVSILGSLIKKDYTESDDLWLQTLLNELVDEGFIVKKQGMVVLAS